jgi:hypothetical protein
MTPASRSKPFSPELLYVGLSQLVLLAIGLHWAQPPTGIAQIDLPPPFDPANLLHKTALAWNHVVSYAGSVDVLFSLVPYLVIEALLEKIAGLSVGQALLFVLPVMISWIGAYKCGRIIGLSTFAAFVAAWVFAFIPVRQQMIGVFLSAEVCTAALPWVFYWAMSAAREPARRKAAAVWLASIACVALAVVAVTPQLIVAVLIGLVAWLFLCARFSPDARAYWRWAGVATTLAITTSLWWLVPIAISFLGVKILHATAPTDVAWTFARASLLNELRFCATWVWRFPEYNPWAVAFDGSPLLYASGFLAAAGVALSLIVTRGSARMVARFCAIVMLAMLFIAKGVHSPLAAVNEALFKLPGMFLLIEPYGLILVAALVAALACGLAVDAIRARYESNGGRIASALLGAVFVCGVLANNLATITGAIFHEETNILPDVHIALPDDWRSLSARLDATGEPGGVLVLPPDDFYQIDYTWGYHGVDFIPIEVLHRDVLMPGAPFNYTQAAAAASIDATVASLARQRSPLLKPLLRDLGVRYVVARDDVRFMHSAAPARSSYRAAFGDAVGMFGALELYDLGPPNGGIEVRNSAFEPRAAIEESSDAGLREVAHALHAAGVAVDARLSAALMRVLTPIRVQRTLGTRVLSRDEARATVLVPAVVSQVSTSGTTVAYGIRNAAARIVTADIEVGAWPRSDTTFVLAANGAQVGSVSALGGGLPRWIRFYAVQLPPGITNFTVTQRPARGGSLQMFYPPRFAPADASQPKVNQVVFANIVAAQSLPISTQPRGVDIGLMLSTEPSVTVITSQPESAASSGSLIAVKLRDATYGCYADIPNGQTFDLGDPVRHCLSSIGVELTDPDEEATEIVAMTEAGASVSRREVTIAHTAAVDPRDVALLARATMNPAGSNASAQSTEGAVQFAARPSLAAIVPLPNDTQHVVAISEAFSSTWSAIEFGRGGPFPPHIMADGWRNAWICTGPGTLLVFNWLDVLEIVFAALAIFTIIAAARSSRW